MLRYTSSFTLRPVHFRLPHRFFSTTPQQTQEFTLINFSGISSTPPNSLTPPTSKLQKPISLSPSSAMEFKECPQSYLLKYMYKIPQPTSSVLVKGTVVHSALEKVFNLSKGDRTRGNLHNLLRAAWSEYKRKYKGDSEKTLFTNVEDEIVWGKEALKLLDNYLVIEDPGKILAEPVKREMWVKSNITIDDDDDAGGKRSKFLVRGIIDRLDITTSVNPETGLDENILTIVDYKTGKSPHLKYSSEVNERIVNEKFWQLKVYAFLLREMFDGDKGSLNVTGVDGVTIRKLRLMFLTNIEGNAETLEYDLGATPSARAVIHAELKDELIEMYTSICKLVEMEDVMVWKHCEREFCFCNVGRKMFVKGSLGGRIKE